MLQLSAALHVAAYESDLEVDIVDEFIQFHKLLKTGIQQNQISMSLVIHHSGDCVELRAYTNAQAHNECYNLQTVFPNCVSTYNYV